jgi:hypothetical protein
MRLDQLYPILGIWFVNLIKYLDVKFTFSSRIKTLFPLQYKNFLPSGLAESMTGNPRVVLGSDANVHS